MVNRKRFRILIIASHVPWGGLGQYLINLANSLSADGKSDVYGMVTHLVGDGHEGFARHLRRVWDFSSKSRILRYISVVCRVWALRPDVIFINHCVPIQRLLPCLPSCKVISVIHSDDVEYYRVSAINKRYVTYWVAPSNKTMRALVDFLGNEYSERVRLIAHGVDMPAINANVRVFDPFIVLFVGALYEHKGPEVAISVFMRLCTKHPNLCLYVVGEGPLEKSLREMVSPEKRDCVNFLGVLPNSEVRGLMARASVLLFPSRLEGFGLVLVEAMAEGCVPVASMLPGITDSIVKDGHSGYLVPMDDSEAFFITVERLYLNRIELNSISQHARECASREFSMDRMLASYHNLIYADF
jgi:glycosyltransferase involved in cell wall biosynthesis